MPAAFIGVTRLYLNIVVFSSILRVIFHEEGIAEVSECQNENFHVDRFYFINIFLICEIMRCISEKMPFSFFDNVIVYMEVTKD